MDIIKIRSRKIGIGLLIFMLFIAYNSDKIKKTIQKLNGFISNNWFIGT